jgi:hypothetical protein
MTVALEAHTKEKDEAIAMLKEKDKTINQLFEMLKQEIKLGRRND